MMAKQLSQEEVQTREQVKKQRRKVNAIEEVKSTKRIRIRLLPIWLRLLLFIILLAASLAGGLMVGYGVIGDGKPKDVFEKSTWTHIIDLVTEKK